MTEISFYDDLNKLTLNMNKELQNTYTSMSAISGGKAPFGKA
jgi:hypothetical protein